MNTPYYNVNNENEFDYKEYLESINNDLEIIKKEYADPLD
jgi:hypothetical protein